MRKYLIEFFDREGTRIGLWRTTAQDIQTVYQMLAIMPIDADTAGSSIREVDAFPAAAVAPG